MALLMGFLVLGKFFEIILLFICLALLPYGVLEICFLFICVKGILRKSCQLMNHMTVNNKLITIITLHKKKRRNLVSYLWVPEGVAS